MKELKDPLAVEVEHSQIIVSAYFTAQATRAAGRGVA
ncbi:hypothetical protein ACVIJW_000766 [Bradyrhizobium barranii subsp. barranii]